MKKGMIVLLVVCMLFCTVGCSVPNDVEQLLKPTEQMFSVDTYGLQITADSTFFEKTGGSFDLQITNEYCYVSVMAYKYIDLPSGTTPQDVYEVQNEGLFGKRENVSVVEGEKTQALSQGEITYALYSAEKDGVKNYYATYLVDFPQEETLAWVLITATPSYLDVNREFLHGIVCSLTTVE